MSELPLPPQHLRLRVSGVADAAEFERLGQRSIVDLKRALFGVGRPIAGFKRLLDWGCGCGRIIRHLPSHFYGEVYGCDIDSEAIEWLSGNLDFVRADVCGGLPPLPYEDAFFDLIINHSVLSHLDEAYQDAWLAELARALSPEGILILTVHGTFTQRHWAANLPDEPNRADRIRKMYKSIDLHGIYYMQDGSWAADFPAYYQNTLHTPWYIFEHWSKFFDIASYIPRGSLGMQDMVVLRHKVLDVPARTEPDYARRVEL